MLTSEQAHTLLLWAHEQNPGPWLAHSQNAAKAAETIARACGLDEERAYLMGLLHDIGRYEGVRGMHHVIAGYELMMTKNQHEIARICLTHSFPVLDTDVYTGPQDCTAAEMAFLKEQLARIQLDEYDRLIQLCDALAMPDGISTIEERLFEGTLRHGFNDHTLRKWQAFIDLKKHFDKCCGSTIYSLFRDEITVRIFGKNEK